MYGFKERYNALNEIQIKVAEPLVNEITIGIQTLPKYISQNGRTEVGQLIFERTQSSGGLLAGMLGYDSVYTLLTEMALSV